MKITDIKLNEINDNSESIYDVSIIIENCVCLTDIKINLYTDEMVVVYPDNISPVNNDVKSELDDIILDKLTHKRPLHEKLAQFIK
ncbi:MAG: SpoVG family protein [Alphaproteobacteria bacterium]|nr:SpoVG family protein [Alphaproteobacteria bacterium]